MRHRHLTITSKTPGSRREPFSICKQNRGTSRARIQGGQAAAVTGEVTASEEIASRAVQLRRTVKVAYHRPETILTDLSPELADEIVAAGYGEYVEVGIPADEIVDGDGNPVDANEVAIGDNETA